MPQDYVVDEEWRDRFGKFLQSLHGCRYGVRRDYRGCRKSDVAGTIRRFRHDLLAEHLDVSAEEVRSGYRATDRSMARALCRKTAR